MAATPSTPSRPSVRPRGYRSEEHLVLLPQALPRPHGRRRRHRRRRDAAAALAALGRGRRSAGGQSPRCGARGGPHAGEPFVRPLFRHPAGCPRLRRQLGQTRRVPAGRCSSVPGTRRRQPGFAVGGVHRLAPARLGRRAAGASARPLRRVDSGEGRGHDGVLRPPRHPVPVRPRRDLHRLRRILLIVPHVDEPEPELSVLRDQRVRAVGAARRRQRGVRLGPSRVHVAHVRRVAAVGGRRLARVPGVGQLHRQQPRLLRHVPHDRSRRGHRGRSTGR